MKITLYDALNVSRSAAPDVIEAAYQNLVQEHQVSGSLESQNQLNLGKYAYEILSKPEERIRYDKQISGDHRFDPPSQVDLLGKSDFGDASATWWRSPSSWGVSVAIALLIGFGYYSRGNSDQNSVAKSESIDALQRQGKTFDTVPTAKESSRAANPNQTPIESKESTGNESVMLSTNSTGLLKDPGAPRTSDDGNDSRIVVRLTPKESNHVGDIESENSGNKSDGGQIQPPKMQEVVSQQQQIQRLQLQHLQQQQMQLEATQKQQELQRLQQQEIQRQLAATRKQQEQQRLQQEEIQFQLQMQALTQSQPPSPQVIGPQFQQQVIQPQGQLPQVQLQPQAAQSQGAQAQQQRQQLRQDCLAALPSQATMSKAMQKAGTSSSSMAGLIAQRRAVCDSMQ